MLAEKVKQDSKYDSFGRFMRSMGKTALLTTEQEVSLARLVQMGERIKEARDLNMTDAEISELLNIPNLRSAEHQAVRAKQKMIEANLRLVVKIAKKYQNRGLTLEELVQEGTIGMEHGIRKFDPDKGNKLSTYIYHWIRQGITRSIQNDTRTIRLPIHLGEAKVKIQKYQAEFHELNHRYATVKEIYEATGLTESRILAAIRGHQSTLSLDAKVAPNRSNGDPSELGSFLEDTSIESPDDFVERIEMQESIDKLLKECKLSDREVVMLSLRFGIEDGVQKSLEEVGRLMGISRECARQLQVKAIRKLKGAKEGLTAQEKQIFQLRCGEGLTLAATAERLNLTPNQVAYIQKRAIDRMKFPDRKHLDNVKDWVGLDSTPKPPEKPALSIVPQLPKSSGLTTDEIKVLECRYGYKSVEQALKQGYQPYLFSARMSWGDISAALKMPIDQVHQTFGSAIAKIRSIKPEEQKKKRAPRKAKQLEKVG